ncbi:F0F1 ATP synthase subunit alpha [Candidatus Campbellbacteria bacterium]|nr:MAG: F0F1 ATP synthase subunit alpha [Candidatus Campbellbacteria bacterium]
MSDLILEKIKREIENFSLNTEENLQTGIVSSVADGVVEIKGLENAFISEMLVLTNQTDKSLKELIENQDEQSVVALVLNVEADSIKAVVLGQDANIKEGSQVLRTEKILSLGVSDEIIGRVVDALGKPIDGKGEIKVDKEMFLEREAFGVMDRDSVNEPLQTGIKAVDSMIPIGRGQRELIIGDRQTGKTTIAIDTILNQINEPVETRPICVYVSVGQKDSKTAQIVANLEKNGAMDYTVVVSAGASAEAALQYLAPFAGVAIAEYFMEKGKDVLIIYDDLSKHAVAYRQMSLILRRPPGREAYPGDVFYLHSRLLERSAKVNEKLGGGSITALPIIETQEGDVSAYIPTNVISITDGQIFLDLTLFNKGIKPAVDVGLSVSRVGSAAQTKAMKSVSGPVKLQLAQFRELEAFAQFASDLDQGTKDKMDASAKVVEALKQENNSPLSFEKQAVVLFFVTNADFVKEIPVSEIQRVEKEFLEILENEKPEILKDIKETKKITDETKEDLTKFILDFVKTFKEEYSTEEK